MSCGCNENKKMTLKEELEVNDIQQIRKLIRHELARVFFDLYRKKKQWEGQMKKLLIDTMIFEVTPTMLKEAKNQHGRFLVNGVLQIFFVLISNIVHYELPFQF